MGKRESPSRPVLRVRNHLAANPPFATVWLLWLDGPAESCLMHGELSPAGVELVAGIMSRADVELDLLESHVPAAPLLTPAPQAGPVQGLLPGTEG